MMKIYLSYIVFNCVIPGFRCMIPAVVLLMLRKFNDQETYNLTFRGFDDQGLNKNDTILYVHIKKIRPCLIK